MLDHGQAASEVMNFIDDTTFEEECRPDVECMEIKNLDSMHIWNVIELLCMKKTHSKDDAILCIFRLL